jgi:thiol-disulfide isomerase/thioredoxin
VKKLLIISILLVQAVHIFAQEEKGIDFQTHLSWQEVLAEASGENKLIFIDLYTSWCGPCKRLEKEIFTQDTVAEKFNTSFINYRIDAEKGEGQVLAEKFGVTGYPYLVFANDSGQMVYVSVGYKGVEALIALADQALAESKTKKPMGAWESEYKHMHENPDWLKGYIQKRNLLRLDNRNHLEDYYNMIPENAYALAENLDLIINSSGLDLESPLLRLVSEIFDQIPASEDSIHFLQTGLIGTYDGAINPPFMKAINENDEQTILTKIAPLYESLWPETVRGMPWYQKLDGDMWKFIYYKETAQVDKLIPVASRFLRKFYSTMSREEIRLSDSLIYQRSKVVLAKQGMNPESPMITQMLAHYTSDDHLRWFLDASYTIANHSEDQQQLELALEWAKRALYIKENAATLEINSRLEEALENE